LPAVTPPPAERRRRWYTEPETFVALTALVVSISAVAVGIYEASLQRKHDVAEVWPHVELSVFSSPAGATLNLENNGIGPAIIKSVVVTVDGHPRRDWADAARALLGGNPSVTQTSTVVERALRPGDKVTMVGIGKESLAPGFWQYVGRVAVRICYASVFEDHWLLSDDHLGGASAWTQVHTCPAPASGTDF
jgi:hypothetical protein